MSIWNSYARLQALSRNARNLLDEDEIEGAMNRELEMLGRNTPRIGGIDTAIKNEARKLRSRRRILRSLPPGPESEPPSGEVEARSEISVRLARLRPIEARVLVRSALGDTLSFLAAIEEMPLGTIKSHLSRGRATFKSETRPRCS